MNYLYKQAVLNKLASARLAINHVYRYRLTKSAAPRWLVESMVGDLIPDSSDKGYSEASYLSNGLFGDDSLTPTIQKFYDPKKPNYTNIQQVYGVFELMRQHPELMERFKKHYLSLTPQQRESHPLSKMLNTASGLSVVKMKGMSDAVNSYRNQFINYNSQSPSFDLNGATNRINDMILNNSYVSPHIPTYQKVINPVVKGYKPAPIPVVKKPAQPIRSTTTTGH